VYASSNGQPSFRHHVRDYLDRAAALSGLMAVLERRRRQTLTILMYHRVLPTERCEDYPLEALALPLELFETQMRWLARHCEVRSLRDAISAYQSGTAHKRPIVAVTFDDGYADNFEHATPVLDELGLHGTFFVTSDFVRLGGPLWFDLAADAWGQIATESRADLVTRLYRELDASEETNGASSENGADAPLAISTWMEGLKRATPGVRQQFVDVALEAAGGRVDAGRYTPMTAAQVAGLSARGHEIGAHTVTHPILPQLSDAELRRELAESRAMLRDWSASDVSGFCYPNGDFDAHVEVAVMDAGYTYACTTITGVNDRATSPFRLARLPMTTRRTMGLRGARDVSGFRAELCGLRELLR
jgi:peptidoglycan/xylan/chitin deacetylase (PgdA/CDA1 family)